MAQLDVLVVGSTGRQGGAVARALLQGGHRVRALTRDLAHPAAELLRLRGAVLAWADIEDEARLEDVARGVDAIFAVTSTAPADPARETRHGLILAELARRLQIQHLIYSSALRASRWRGAADTDSKHEVEQYLRAAQIPHTIVCPAFFMENFLAGELLAGIREHSLRLSLPPAAKLQLLASADLGRFVRLVLEHRADFLERRICIASDELTPLEIAAVLARALKRAIYYDASPDAIPVAAATDRALLYGSADSAGARAHIDELRQHYPEVNWHTLEDWAAHQDWTVLDKPVD